MKMNVILSVLTLLLMSVTAQATTYSDANTLSELLAMRQNALANSYPGLPHATTNLHHWLNGDGSPIDEDTDWLKTQDPIKDAMKTIKGWFQTKADSALGNLSISNYAKQNIGAGNLSIPETHWDKLVKGKPSTDLYYSSGDSTLTGYGDFSAVKDAAGKITISGSIGWSWYDFYNWDTGKWTVMPNGDAVADSAFLKLQQNGRGQDFVLRGNWDEDFRWTLE